MDNKKFEKLIDLIINENEEQARELFHEIVVEKSREIYENIMMDEMGMEDEGGMAGQTADLLDEINAEEEGMTEDEDDLDDLEGVEDDEVIDLDADELGAEEGEGEVEDAVVRIEDKLDQLMAEFEDLMATEEDEEADEEDFGDEGDEEDFGDEGDEEDFGDEEDGEEDVMEAVQLKQVPGLYGSKIGGDNGAQPKSPIGKTANAGQAGMASKPVKFSGDTETVPTSPKGPTGYPAKGETQVKGAGSFKNSPGQDAGKSSFKEKAPRDFGKKDSSTGKLVGADGSAPQNDKSPVAESRKSKKKIVK